jgi:hypothetical protein
MPLASLFSSKKPQETANMPDVQAQQPTLQLDELVAQLANQEQAATELASQLAVATLRAEQAEQALSIYQADAKTAFRKASLSAVVADEKVEEMYSSTATLDDTAFQSIVTALASTVKAKEMAFEELGKKAADEPAKDFTTQMMALTADALNKGKK